jgi:hypothetical protein
MVVRARSTAGVWSSTGNITWTVTNDPTVTSKEFQANGRVFPGTFTLEARQPGAVAFEYSFSISSAPYVSSKEYPESKWSGGPGVPGTFTFTPGMPGIVSYTCYIRNDRGAVTEELTVPADSSGAGTMTWTPPDRGIYSVTVRGNTADGTRSGGISYSVYVN